MKKTLILVAALALFLTGCQSRDEVPSSSSDADPTVISPAPTTPPFYTELVERKEELVPVVAERVADYREDTPPENENHHAAYPDNFPDAEGLPFIMGTDDFAIRYTGNIDELGGIYVAVRIDDNHEMHMTMAEYLGDDGVIRWSSGNTFFATRSEVEYVLEDIDLYAGIEEEPTNLPLDGETIDGEDNDTSDGSGEDEDETE